MKAKFTRIIKQFSALLIRFLSSISLSRTEFLFTAKYGFSDNSKYLFEYYLRQGLSCTWIASCDRGYRDVSDLIKDFPNGKVTKRNSPRLIFLLAKARYVFVTHSFNDLGGIAVKTCPIVNLWHGIPIKKMGFDSQNDIELFSLETFNPYKINDFVMSSSEVTKPFMVSCMALDAAKVLPLGQPRNDFLLENRGNRKLINRLRQNYCSSDEFRLILYAPTFRDQNSNARNIYLSLVQSFKIHAQKDDILVLRLHPKEREYLADVELPENIKHSNIFDVQEELLTADMLISDYSSIIFDYSILNRPILIFAPDRDFYLKNRGGSYFNYNDILFECREIDGDRIDSIWYSLNTEEVHYPLMNSLHAENSCKSIFQKFS